MILRINFSSFGEFSNLVYKDHNQNYPMPNKSSKLVFNWLQENHSISRRSYTSLLKNVIKSKEFSPDEVISWESMEKYSSRLPNLVSLHKPYMQFREVQVWKDPDLYFYFLPLQICMELVLYDETLFGSITEWKFYKNSNVGSSLDF